MARPLKPFIRGGGFYPSRKWTPLVYPGGYATANGGGEPEPEAVLKTATGSLIHIADALALPAKALSANISPIQDLHGYDSPWPAGGGKNLDPYDSINNSSRLWGTNNALQKQVFQSLPVGTYTMSCKFKVLTNPDSEDTVQIGVLVRYSDGVGGYVVIIPYQLTQQPATVGAVYEWSYTFTLTESLADKDSLNVYFYCASGGTSTVTANAYDIQIEKGEVSNPTYAPYSNICPISGRTSATVTRTGKNLWNSYQISLSDNSGITATGENSLTIVNKGFQENLNHLDISSFVGKNKTLSFKCKTVSKTNSTAYFYIGGSTSLNIATAWVRVELGEPGTTKEYTATVPANATSVRFGGWGWGGEVELSDIQLSLGSTATAYEPYAGNTYTIQLGDTVYGGTLDVTQGKLTVDRVADTFTKDSTWYGFTTGSGNSSAVVQLSMYQNCKYVDGSASYNGAISSTGGEAQNYWIGARQNETPAQGDMCFAYSSTGQLRFHRLDVASITDLASFKSAFPDTTICYYLSTPIEITLTPTQIDMLLGENNLWADVGDSTLTYYAEGEASTSEALGILLGGTYNNPGGADDVSDDEALGILLGGS